MHRNSLLSESESEHEIESKGKSDTRLALVCDDDDFLRSAIRSSALTECVGPPGVGKTQLCYTLCASVAAGGHGVVYLDTESAFNAERLIEVASAMHGGDVADVAERVVVYACDSCDAISRVLSALDDDMIERDVRLLVVDSIASVVRREGDADTHRLRHNSVAAIASRLKFLAETFDVPVVATNHVTTAMRRARGFNFQQQQQSSSSSSVTSESDTAILTAALGVFWSHSVNARLVLEYRHEQEQQEPGGEGASSSLTSAATVRHLTVAKSPLLPVSTIAYRITSAGIEFLAAQPIANRDNFWSAQIQARQS
jgi:RAD51-like protein 1